MFITVLTTARHWSLTLARYTQSTTSYPVSLRSIVILSSHLRHYKARHWVAGGGDGLRMWKLVANI